jgi:hypothetical protein
MELGGTLSGGVWMPQKRMFFSFRDWCLITELGELEKPANVELT